MGVIDHMSTSDAGLQFIREAEGKGLKGKPFQAYLCSSKVPTIGYGHTDGVTLADVKNGVTITEEQAEAYLRRDVIKWELEVEKTIKVPITQNQYDVFISFVHNCGPTALRAVAKYLHEKGPDAVPARLMLYINGTDRTTGKKYRSPGLVSRRTREVALWNAIALPSAPVEEPVPQAVVPDTGKVQDVVKKSGTFWSAIAALFGTAGGYISDSFNFAGAVIVETQNKLTLTETLYKLLSDNMKEIFVAVAVIGAIGVVWRRVRAEKEKKTA